jgi:hypothetical protein
VTVTLAYTTRQYLDFLNAFPADGLTGPEALAALRATGMGGTTGGYYVGLGACLRRDPVTDRRHLTRSGRMERQRMTDELAEQQRATGAYLPPKGTATMTDDIEGYTAAEIGAVLGPPDAEVLHRLVAAYIDCEMWEQEARRAVGPGIWADLDGERVGAIVIIPADPARPVRVVAQAG